MYSLARFLQDFHLRIFTNCIHNNTNLFSGFNTFSSYIIAGLILPTLLIAPFTFSIMLPNWLSPSNKNYKNSKRTPINEVNDGDIYLYEKGELTQYALLKLSAKYILYHSTRVSIIQVNRLRSINCFKGL